MFSPRQGHSTSIAAMIIMISSNEGATGVNATRSLFPLTQPVITAFFCLFLSDSQGYTHSVLVLYHVILFPITLLSSCPVTRPDNADKGAPKTRVRRGRGDTKELRLGPHYGTAGVTVQLMSSVTPPANLQLLCQGCCLFVTVWRLCRSLP